MVHNNSWWGVLKPNPSATIRLFCFPYGGGSGLIFRPWQAHLPGFVELYYLQLPGRYRRIKEPPLTHFREVVTEAAQALLPLARGPFAFFGHSLGAVLSFEVARWLLSHKHRAPEILFVSGRRAPQIPDEGERFHEMNDQEFVTRVSELQGTPPELLADKEFVQFILPTLRADFKMIETYEYVDGGPLPCFITAFGGTEDEESHEGRLEAWSCHTSRGFSQYMIKGNHFFLHGREREMLRLLRRELSKVTSGNSMEPAKAM